MRDPKVEQFLDKIGYSYRYITSVPLNTLDMKASLDPANTGRLHGIVEEIVDEMLLKLEEGYEFPALVLLPRRNKPFLVAGGCHRLTAFQRAGQKSCDAYVVTIEDEYDRQAFCRVLNRKLEGHGTSQAEAIQHAAFLVTHYKKTIKDVAKQFSLSTKALAVALRAMQVGDRAASLGIPIEKLPQTIRDTLGQLHNDVVFERAIRLVLAAHLGTDAVKTLVAEVKSAKDSEKSQLDVVERWRKRPDIMQRMHQKPTGPRAPLSPTFFTRSASLLRTLTECNTTDQFGFTSPALRERARIVAGDLTARLKSLVKLLDDADDDEET